jgi:hypothetical protein
MSDINDNPARRLTVRVRRPVYKHPNLYFARQSLILTLSLYGIMDARRVPHVVHSNVRVPQVACVPGVDPPLRLRHGECYAHYLTSSSNLTDKRSTNSEREIWHHKSTICLCENIRKTKHDFATTIASLKQLYNINILDIIMHRYTTHFRDISRAWDFYLRVRRISRPNVNYTCIVQIRRNTLVSRLKKSQRALVNTRLTKIRDSNSEKRTHLHDQFTVIVYIKDNFGNEHVKNKM